MIGWRSNMPRKSMNKRQIDKLDSAIKQLGRKGVKGKDMESAIKQIMKDMGIKESNLDDLSLSMKHITKSGISPAVTKDKKKIGLDLKALRKKLDTKKEDAKKPVRIVRSKKSTAKLHRISRQDNKLIRKEEVEQIDEALPIAVAPIAVNVARAVGTKVVKNVLKKQIKKRAKKAARRGALASKLMNRSSNKSSGSSVTGTNRRSSSGGSKAGAGNIATSTARDRSKDRRDELDKERLRRQKERERRQKMARDD